MFDADEKSLGEIARETLAEHVRDGTITPPQLGGGTRRRPPSCRSARWSRAVAHEGGITIRNTMALTLACDHRILYGADAAQFLARIRQLLAAPAALTL